jgi:hypothetical protein
MVQFGIMEKGTHTNTHAQAAWSVSIKLSTLFTTFLSSAHKGRTRVGQERKIYHIEDNPKIIAW